MMRCGTIVAGLFFCLPAPAAEPKVSYRNDVQPILKRHCWGCHSSAKPKGKLSLDTVADMRKGGRSGPLFEAGKPDVSRLIEAISGPEPAMPQKQPPLSMEKIHILRNWVLDGRARRLAGRQAAHRNQGTRDVHLRRRR